MVDFTLSPEQKTLQIFAQDNLLDAHLLYQDLPTPRERFLILIQNPMSFIE
jgi:hypothetical protein